MPIHSPARNNSGTLNAGKHILLPAPGLDSISYSTSVNNMATERARGGIVSMNNSAVLTATAPRGALRISAGGPHAEGVELSVPSMLDLKAMGLVQAGRELHSRNELDTSYHVDDPHAAGSCTPA